MRLATAADEILPLRDPRVQQNEAYLTVIVLSRVIVRLGSLSDIHTGVIEGLFAADLAYLQRLYERFNADDDERGACARTAARQRRRPAQDDHAGGSLKAYPVKTLYEEMAFIAMHFHWSHGDLMRLEHRERRRWCAEISADQPRAQRHAGQPVRRVRRMHMARLDPLARLPLPRRDRGHRQRRRCARQGPGARDQARVVSRRRRQRLRAQAVSQVSYPPLVLERGLALTNLWQWAQDVANGIVAPQGFDPAAERSGVPAPGPGTPTTRCR